MNNTWKNIKEEKPIEGQKVYYFSKNLSGIFRGEYHYISSSYSNPHKFSSRHGVVDADDISHWMPYDHSLRDIIPLPPDYVGCLNQAQDEETVEIPDGQKMLVFSYSISGDI